MTATPPRLYYGWLLVVGLGVTATVSYGILAYAFPVFLVPMEAELGWSRTALTGAFSLAALVAGVAAIPIGHWLDRHGARAAMTVGSIAATLLLLAWSGVQRLWAFYAIWVGLGIASAAVFYEPAFAVLATWFSRRRGRALTVLTFMGGFASVVFVPLATWLVEVQGWRAALISLALILAGLTIPVHALLLRRHPSDVGQEPDGDDPVHGVTAIASTPVVDAVKSRSFRLLVLAFSFGSLLTTALVVHIIPLLLERGFDATFAGAVLGGVGLMALPGRLILTPLGGRWPRSQVTAVIFALQAVGTLILLAGTATWTVWAFVALFGAGFGAITPARAALVAELYGPASFGRISGTLALPLSVARAIAPVGASLLYLAVGGYDGVLVALSLVALMAAGAVLHTGGGTNRPAVPA